MTEAAKRMVCSCVPCMSCKCVPCMVCMQVRAVFELLLGRVEREVARDAKGAAKGAAKEEAARARQVQKEERVRLVAARRAEKVARGGTKRSRCGACAGCRAGNCGKCACCLDMPRFGGTGGRRQPCKYRACTAVQEILSTWLMCDRCATCVHARAPAALHVPCVRP